MLNLLYISFLIFSGYIENAELDAGYNINAIPEIAFNETTIDYDTSTDFTIEIGYYLSFYSTDFEEDTGYDVQLIETAVYSYDLADTHIYDLSTLRMSIEYYDLVINYGVQSNLSFIDISFTTYITLDLTYVDNYILHDSFEDTIDILNYTNFTIYENRNFYLNDFFNVYFNYDFIETYQDGYDVGYEDGYDNGFRNGEDFGYEQGSNDLDNVFNGSWVEWLGNAVTGFFALEIFPGFSLAGALGAVLCAYIMMWILKVLAGG